MTIGEIMTTSLVTVSEDARLDAVQAMLQQHDIHHLLVRDAEGEIVGAITDRDVLRELSPFVGKLAERRADRETLTLRAHQIMTHDVPSVSPEMEVPHATRILLQRRVSCLAVRDAAGVMVGIVTWRDLLRAMAGTLTDATPGPHVP